MELIARLLNSPQLMSVPLQAQGAQGPGVPDSGGSPLAAADNPTLSPSFWTEKGERTSVASEISFVSAISTDINTSLPDVIQLASPSKLNGVESDTDTSTAYESAGETEGNISSVDDQFAVSSRELHFQRPIAVSSPFEVDLAEPDSSESEIEVLTSNSSSKSGHLNETVPLEDSADNAPRTLEWSLSEHFSGLSINTPLKLKHEDCVEKGHITLDSDVSADVTSSPGPDDTSAKSDAEDTESLETTFTLTDSVEGETVSQSPVPEEVDNSERLEKTVDVSSDSSADEEPNEVASIEERQEKKDLNTSLINSPIKQSSCDNVVSNAVNGNVSIDGHLSVTVSKPYEDVCKSPIDSPTPNQSELSLTELKFLESLEKSWDRDVGELDKTVIEVEEKSQIVKLNLSPLCDNSLETTPEEISKPVQLSTEQELEPAIGVSEECISQSEEQEELGGVDTHEGLADERESVLPSKVSEPLDDVKQTQTLGEPKLSAGFSEDAPLPVKVPRSFDEILAEQLAIEDQPVVKQPVVSIPPASSFDEAPLPARAQRTFKEILADELGADVQIPEATETAAQGENSSLEEPCVSTDVIATPEVKLLSEKKCAEDHQGEKAVALQGSSASEDKPLCEGNSSNECQVEKAVALESLSAPDEIPIPLKGGRTFEEILAAELAAQKDPELAVPSFSTSQGIKVSPRKLEESFANIISSETTALEAESEPELISDPVIEDLESVNDGLDTLIERCKQQELDLELADSKNLAPVVAQYSSNCLSESVRIASTSSVGSEYSEFNETVVMVDSDPFASNSKVGFSPNAANVQVAEVSLPFGITESNNLDSEEFRSGDLFKDPSAFDFLSLHGGTRSARDLRKESLYVKFDPLVGSLVSDTRLDSSFTMHPENSSENQNGASASTDDGLQTTESPLNTSEKLVSLSPSTASKQARDSSDAGAACTPVRVGLVKSTPVKTPAHVMLNETLESIGARGTIVKQEDLIKKLQEHQSILEEQDKAYQERISDLEQRLQEVELRKAEELKEKDKQLDEKAISISELRVVMKEYEQTISRIVGEKSQQKAAFEESQVELIKDRDEAQQHLNNMEMAFADIHKKYERLKSVLDAFKKNEESLNTALAEKNANIDKIQKMYDMLKSHAVQKLEKANQDLETMKQKHQQENAKLKAMIKKLEIKTKSLEEALEQKVKENQALTAICDELINKVED